MAKQIQVNLMFQANTKAAIANLESLSRLLSTIGSNTAIGVDAGPLAQATDAARQLQVHLQNAVNVDTGKLNLNKLNASLKSAGTSLQTLTANLQMAGPAGQQAFIKIATAVASAEAPMMRFNKHLLAMGQTLLNTAKWQMASTAIHAIGSAINNTVRHAEELNTALTDISIVTGYGTESMAQFAQQANKAAEVLNTTTTEYAKAALIFYQQGLTENAVTERADVVVKLAQVTGMSAQSVSDQMTAIWNNFDNGSKSLEYYADAITKLGASTAASSEEIAAGLEKFAAIADTVGLSYETATAAVATVIDKTRQSADVIGTAFKTIFARIEGLSLGDTLEDGVDLNKYSQALDAVGISVLNTSGELRNMDDILSDLGEKWNYFGQETKVALAQTVGGLRQYNQMIALMDNWDAVQKNIDLAKNSSGELSKQQSLWASSYEAASDRVTKAQEDVYEALISDEALITIQNVFAEFLKIIEHVVSALGGIGPILLTIAALSSKVLVPALAKGALMIRDNWRVATGQATQDIMRMQEMIKIGMTDMMNNSQLSSPMQQQILLSKELLTAKQKLTEASKNLTASQLEEAERRMAVYEAMVAEAQGSLELQAQLEKEIALNKEQLTSGANRQVLATASAKQQFQSTHTSYSTEYVDDLATDAKTFSSAEIQAQQAEAAKKIQQEAADIMKSDMADREQALSDLKIKEEEQKQRYQDILELQRLIGKEARKTAEELKNVAVGSSEGFFMDPEYQQKNTSGLALAQKGQSRQAQAATGQEMLSKVASTPVGEGGLTQGLDGNIDASLGNLEKLLTKMGEYKAQAQELATINKDLTMSYDDYGAEITEAAINLDGYEQSLQEIKTAEAEREAALRTLIEAENNAATAGKKDKAAAEAVKQAKDKVRTAEINLSNIQSKSTKQYQGLSKQAQTYVKQLSSVRTALRNAAKSSSASEAELKKIDRIFKALGQGGEPAKQALETLKATIQRLSGGSAEAAAGIDNLATSITNELIGAGMNSSQIEAFVANLEKMGIISPEIANKIRQIANAGEDMGAKMMKGSTLATTALTQLGTMAGQLSMAASAVQGFVNAFDEGNSPLQTTISLLMSISMLLPIIAGSISFITSLQKVATGVELALAAAKAAGIAVDKKKVKQIWAEHMAESALLSVKIMAAAVEKFGIVGVAVGAAALVAATGAIIGTTIALKKKAQAQQEANEVQSQASANTAEAIDKTQELSKAVSDLSDEYERLAKAGKSTTETIDQMNEKIPELITAYRDLAKSMGGAKGLNISEATDELEYLANIAELTGDYSEFNKKQAELNDLITQYEYANAMSGAQATGTTAAKSMTDATNGSISGNTMTLKLDGSDGSWGKGFWSWLGIGGTESEYGVGNDKDTKTQDRTDEEKVASSILQKNAADYYSTKGSWSSGMFAKEQISLSVDYTNAGEFVDYYEKLQESQQTMIRTMSAEQLKNSDIYRELNDALEAGKEHYDKMLPLAQAQADSGGALTEALIKNGGTLNDGTDFAGGVAMSDIDSLEDYIKYKTVFVELAKSEYGLTEAQAEMYLREAESISRVAQEYELAEQMLKNFLGVDIEHLGTNALEELNTVLHNTFGELSDEELSVAVSLAATSTSLQDFSEKMQQALIVSARQGYSESATLAAETMQAAIENGSFNFNTIFNDENFIAYLEEIGVTQTQLLNANYEEQYRIVSEYYSKVNSLMFDTFTAQQELYYQTIADRQSELAAARAALQNNAGKVAEKQEEYAELKTQLTAAVSDEEKAEIQSKLNQLAADFETDFHFSITSNVEAIQSEIDDLFDKLDELQDKKIEMAMDWSGTDQVENGLKQAAAFAKMIEKETKKTGNNYVLTAQQARQWLEFYPELSAIAQTTTDGLIEMDQEKVQQFMKGNDIALDNSIDTQIQELKAQKTSLQAQLDLRQIDLDAAIASAENEMQINDVSAQYLVDLRKNLVKYFMDLGMDEVTANAQALEQMGLNEDEYTNKVASACQTQAENIEYAAEEGANVQVDSLKQVGEKWKSFGLYLVENIGPILRDIGAAILDPTRSVKDVMLTAWIEGTKGIDVSLDTSGFKSDTTTMNLGYYTPEEIRAAREQAIKQQIDDIKESMKPFEEAINSIDGQIDYLTALKNQDLSNYGDTSIDNDDTADMLDALERYHEINQAIEDQERLLKRLSKAKERAFGNNKLRLMDQEIDTLKTQLSLYKDKEKALLANTAIDLDDAQSYFNTQIQTNQFGSIKNYSKLVQEAQSAYYEAKAIYDSSDKTDEDKKTLQNAKDLYDLSVEALENYEKTLQEYHEIQDTILETKYQIQDANYEKIQYKLELKIKVNDAELRKIDYYLNKLADDFYAMSEALETTLDKIPLATKSLEDYEATFNELIAAFNTIDPNTGLPMISEEDYIAGLEDAYNGIYDKLEAIQEVDKEMRHYYEDTLSAGAEELAIYTSHMEHLTSVLDHYQNIVTMMNGEMDFDNIGTILEGKASTLNNEMKVAESNYAMLKAEQAAMQAAYDAADAEGKKYLKSSLDAINAQVDEAHEAMLSKTKEWAEAQRAIMENSMKKAAHEMEMAFTNNMGFDALNSSMDRLSSYSDEYLTKTNQIYETQKLMNTAQQAIDKTTNQAAKVRLENYNKEIKQLQEKNKLSNLELDIAKAKYDVLLAEIALEEAQNAKATVRLQRDSEGNYGYVYTADKENIAKAEQDLADAQNALYNIGLEGANDYGSKLLDLQQQLADELIALEEARAAGQYKTDEEYYAAKERLISEYNNLFEAYSDQYTTALEVDTVIQQEAWVNAYDEMILKTEDWQIHVDEYTTLCEESYSHWREIVQAESDIVTDLLGNVSDAVKNVTDESNNLKDKIVKEVIPEIENEYTQVRTAVLAYESLRAGLQLTITKYEELAEAIQKAMRQQALFEGQTNLPEDPDVPGEEEEVSPEEPDNKIGHSEMIDLVEDIMVHGSYKNDPERTQKILDAGYTAADRAAAQQIINDIARNESAAWHTGKNWDKVLDEYTTKYGYNTGGYTGEWGPEGRLAVLHQKELILNASDTQNFLIATEILRSIADIIDINSLHSQISQLTPVGMTTSGQQTLEQAVSIEAHFPNVTDRNEIEEAFNNLINTASQYANRKF